MAVGKGSHILGCVRKRVASRSGEVILPFCLVIVRLFGACELYLECCAQFGAPMCKEETDTLEQAQCRATRMVRALVMVCEMTVGGKKICMFLYRQ